MSSHGYHRDKRKEPDNFRDRDNYDDRRDYRDSGRDGHRNDRDSHRDREYAEQRSFGNRRDNHSFNHDAPKRSRWGDGQSGSGFQHREQHRPPPPPRQPKVQVFVGRIGSLTEGQLKEYFSRFGPVIEVRIITDRETGQPKGFGFVSFPDASIANTVLQSGEHHTIGNQTVVVKMGEGSKPSPQQQPGNHHQHHPPSRSAPSRPLPDPIEDPEGYQRAINAEARALFEQNREATSPDDDRKVFVVCSKRVSEFELYEQFEGLGEIESCRLLKDAQGNSKGCAYITFANTTSAYVAVEHMDGIELYDKPLKVQFANPNQAPPKLVKKETKTKTKTKGDEEDEDEEEEINESGYVYIEEEVDPAEEAIRNARLHQVVEMGVQIAHDKMKEIDEKVEAASKGRQYNPDEYDY